MSDIHVLQLSGSSCSTPSPNGKCSLIPLLGTPVNNSFSKSGQLKPVISIVLDGVIAFVDVRTESDNRSRAIGHELQQLGAVVVDRLTDDVTHVIYKDGRKRTLDAALKRKLHLVTVLWVESCRIKQSRDKEDLFRVSLPEKKRTPMAINKFKRYKSMQPKDFEEELVLSEEKCEKRRKRWDKQEKRLIQTTPLLCRTTMTAAKFFTADTQADSSDSDGSKSSVCIAVPDTPPSMREHLARNRFMQPNVTIENSEKLPECNDEIQRKLFYDDEDNSMKRNPNKSEVIPSKFDGMSDIACCDVVRTEVSMSSRFGKAAQDGIGESLGPEIELQTFKNIRQKTVTFTNVVSVHNIPGRIPTDRIASIPETPFITYNAKPDCAGVDISPMVFNNRGEKSGIVVERRGSKRGNSPLECSRGEETNKRQKMDESCDSRKSPKSPSVSFIPMSQLGSGSCISPQKQSAPKSDLLEVAHLQTREEKSELAHIQTQEEKSELGTCEGLFPGSKAKYVVDDKRIVTGLRRLKSKTSVGQDSGAGRESSDAHPPGKILEHETSDESKLADCALKVLFYSKSVDVEKQSPKSITKTKTSPKMVKNKKIVNGKCLVSGLSRLKSKVDNNSNISLSDGVSNCDQDLSRSQAYGTPDVGEKGSQQPNTSACVDKKKLNLLEMHFTSDENGSETDDSVELNTSGYVNRKPSSKVTLQRLPAAWTDKNSRDSAALPSCQKTTSSQISRKTESPDNKSKGSLQRLPTAWTDENSGSSATPANRTPRNRRSSIAQSKKSNSKVSPNETLTGSDENLCKSAAILPNHRSSNLFRDCSDKSKDSKMKTGKDESRVVSSSSSSGSPESGQEEKKKSKKKRSRSTSSNRQRSSELKLKPDPDALYISTTSLHRGEQDLVKQTVEDLGIFTLSDDVLNGRTRIVSGENRRTVKILTGIAKGCWILSLDWVKQSAQAGQWLDEEPFEHTFFPAIKTNRFKRCQKMNEDGYSIDIFSGCGFIYVASGTSPPKQQLESLVGLCGGKVTNQLRQADICVGKFLRQAIVNVSEKWILDSITADYCLSTEQYTLTS